MSESSRCGNFWLVHCVNSLRRVCVSVIAFNIDESEVDTVSICAK